MLTLYMINVGVKCVYVWVKEGQMNLVCLPEDILVTCILSTLEPIDYQSMWKTCKYLHLICRKYIQQYINHIPIKHVTFNNTSDVKVYNLYYSTGIGHYVRYIVDLSNVVDVDNSPYTASGKFYIDPDYTIGQVVFEFHWYPIVATILNDETDTYIISTPTRKLIKTDNLDTNGVGIRTRNIKIYDKSGRIITLITGTSMTNRKTHTIGHPMFSMNYNTSTITRHVCAYGSFISKKDVVVSNLYQLTNDEVLSFCKQIK